MKIKGIPIWLALVAILGISGAVYFFTGVGQALGALVILTGLYFFPMDNEVAAGNAEAAKTDAYREQWLGRRKARTRRVGRADPQQQVSPSGEKPRRSANGRRTTDTLSAPADASPSPASTPTTKPTKDVNVVRSTDRSNSGGTR